MKYLLYFAIACVLVILYLPSLKLPWSLIDDGQRILINQEMETALMSGDFKNFLLPPVDNLARFRPAYWSFHYLAYILLGIEPIMHHILRLAVLAITLALFYLLSIKYFKKETTLLAVLIFIAFPGNLESYLRLGPQEPLLLLWGLLSAWLIRRGKLSYSLLSSVLFFATKEAAIFILPAIVYLLLTKPSKSQSVKKYLLFNLILGLGLLIYTWQLKNYGYASQTSFSLPTLISTALGYIKLSVQFGWLPGILLSGLLAPLFLLADKRTIKPYFALILLSAGYLMIQLAWPHPLARYLTPAMPALSLLIAIPLIEVIRLASTTPINMILKTVALLSLVSILYYSLLHSFSFTSHYTARETLNNRFIDFVAKETTYESRIVFNFNRDPNAREWVVETGMHLELFHQLKPEIDYIYNLEPELEIRADDILVDWVYFDYLPDDDLMRLASSKRQYQISQNYLLPAASIKRTIFKPVASLLGIDYPIFQERKIAWTVYY